MSSISKGLVFLNFVYNPKGASLTGTSPTTEFHPYYTL